MRRKKRRRFHGTGSSSGCGARTRRRRACWRRSSGSSTRRSWARSCTRSCGGKRTDALLALWDRLGFRNGNNTICRTCGTYLEPAQPGAITKPWLDSTRTWFMNELAKAAHMEETEELSDEALSQIEQDKLDDDMASLDIGDGNTAPSPGQ